MERKKIMRWPGQPMDGLNAESISKGTAPPFVIHWAGMKKFRLRNMAGSDILLYFEKYYYSRIPFGLLRRVLANAWHLWTHCRQWTAVRVKLGYRRWVETAMSRRLSQGEKPSIGV